MSSTNVITPSVGGVQRACVAASASTISSLDRCTVRDLSGCHVQAVESQIEQRRMLRNAEHTHAPAHACLTYSAYGQDVTQ